jgi:hypothetical protein
MEGKELKWYQDKNAEWEVNEKKREEVKKEQEEGNVEIMKKKRN